MKKLKQLRRIIALTLSTVLLLTSIPATAKAAENKEETYPYTLYASADYDESLRIDAENLCINGNLATAGSLEAYVEYNFNHNGHAYEDVSDGKVYIYNLLDERYFSGNTEKYGDSYEGKNQNINQNKALEARGDINFTGNVNLNNSIKAYRDINISGETLNANNSCIESKYGDITIETRNVSITGIIYAPFGDVVILAENLNLNNVIVIARSITLSARYVNINHNNELARLIGNTNEELYIPAEDWQYMDDEDEDGLPDFIADEDTWSEFTDTDGDRLPDTIEDFIGTDKNVADTDVDSLDDYYETMISFTNPLSQDSDNNGIADSEEDYDNDGLTICEEMIIGTEPIEPDTDGDTVPDGVEVKENNTNPLEKDTDKDGLDDDDEIICATNPNNPDTNGNGILDGDEIYHTEIEQELGTDEETKAITKVTLTMEMKGNAAKKVTIENTENIDILTTNIVGKVGAPINLTTTEDFNTATMTFHYDRNLLGDTTEDDLAIMWYDEENLQYIELETTLDKEAQTISYTTTHFSTYVVIDKKKWYDEWRKEIDYRSQGAELKYDISFVVDVSESMRGDNLNRAKEALNVFLDTMYEGDKADLVQFNTAGTIVKYHGTSKEALKEAVERLEAGYDTSTNSGIEKGLEALIPYIQEERKAIMILLCDGDVENNAKTQQLINRAKNNNISIYTVNICNSDTEALSYISDSTGGHTYIANTPDDIAQTLQTLSHEVTAYIDMTDTDGDTLPNVLETNGMRIQNGQIVYSNPYLKDTDGDGMPDNEELLLNISKNGSYFVVASSLANYVDSDGDGYPDSIDPEKNKYTYIEPFGTAMYKEVISETGRREVEEKHKNDSFGTNIINFFRHTKQKEKAKVCIDFMMKDVNECKYTYLVSDEDWLSFCLFFNKQVKAYGKVDEELHYFRNKLNRCPQTLNQMIKLINNTEDVNDKWVMCNPNKGRYHMYGETGAYNIKFISSNNTGNIYEAVYDKDGKLITEKDDYGKNMGTYNYASSSKDKNSHTKFDVNTYNSWGNTKPDPQPIEKAEDDNVTQKTKYMEPSIKGTNVVDEDAKSHYIQVCEDIGIKYEMLLKKEYSDKCY